VRFPILWCIAPISSFLLFVVVCVVRGMVMGGLLVGCVAAFVLLRTISAAAPAAAFWERWLAGWTEKEALSVKDLLSTISEIVVQSLLVLCLLIKLLLFFCIPALIFCAEE